MSIFLRFITDKWSIESALIRYGTRSWASHVEFVNTDGQDTLGSRLQGGVALRSYDYCHPTAERWYTAPGIEQAYEAGLTLIGAKYDWRDILGITFDSDWHTNGQYICSEFVAWCFERSKNNVHTMTKNFTYNDALLNHSEPVRKLTPRDLLLSPFLKHVRTIR